MRPQEQTQFLVDVDFWNDSAVLRCRHCAQEIRLGEEPDETLADVTQRAGGHTCRPRTIVDSYDRGAQVPQVGSVWVWELDDPLARCLIRVVEVRWNGEEWWIRTDALLPAPYQGTRLCYNDAGRFDEACTPVGTAEWTTHQVVDGIEFVVSAPG